MHAPTDNLTSCTIVSGAGAHGGSGYRENFLSLFGASNVAPEMFEDVPAACDYYLAGPVERRPCGAREQRALRAMLQSRGETCRQPAAGVWSSHGFIISSSDCSGLSLHRHGIREANGVFFFLRGELAGCRFFW